MNFETRQALRGLSIGPLRGALEVSFTLAETKTHHMRTLLEQEALYAFALNQTLAVSVAFPIVAFARCTRQMWSRDAKVDENRLGSISRRLETNPERSVLAKELTEISITCGDAKCPRQSLPSDLASPIPPARC